MAYQILDKAVYTTTQYLIEDENGVEYCVRSSEDDFLGYWAIENFENGEIDPNSELGEELINFCMSFEEEN